MKVTTDCSVTSRPLRTRSKFDPKSLFTGGEQGVLIGPNPVDKVFADTTASSNALFGNSVARIDDQSGSSHNAIQFSTSLRPLLGRAPVTAAPGGAIDQGSGPAFIRFDLADDVIGAALPAGGIVDLMVFGRKGSYRQQNVEIMPGDGLQIGPYKVTGTPYDLMPSLGDIVGWVAVDRPLTGAEVAALANHHAKLGAKGLLTPTGPNIAPITGMTMNGSGIAGSASVPMAGVYRVSFDIASSDPSGFGVRVTTTNPVSNSVFVNAPGSYSFFVYPSVGSIRLNHGQASNLQLVNIEYRQMVVQEAS